MTTFEKGDRVILDNVTDGAIFKKGMAGTVIRCYMEGEQEFTAVSFDNGPDCSGGHFSWRFKPFEITDWKKHIEGLL